MKAKKILRIAGVTLALAVLLTSSLAWSCAATAPRNLEATAQGNAVRLTWLPPESLGGLTLSGYYVFRATAPGAYNWNSPLHDFVTQNCFYVDATAQAGHTYYYKVKAFFTNNDHSAPSNEASFVVGQAGIVITVDSLIAYVNGEAVTLEAAPTLVNGRVLVPFRFLADSLGAVITWGQETHQVTAAFGGVTVVLTVGVQTAYVNGAPEEIDVPPQIVNGRVLVPLRFLTEHFGWQARWNSASLSATITAGSAK